MFRLQEDELDPTNRSEAESMVMVSCDASSAGFLAQTLNTKKINIQEIGDAEDPQYQDSRIRFSRYCGREFKSDNALDGNLRLHRQHQAKSKAGIHRRKSSKPARKHSPEEEDNYFTCFVCDDSFSSMKLLCQHMRNHREMDFNGIQERIPSKGSFSLTEPETTFEEGIESISSSNDQNQGSCIDFLKDIPNWSQTDKRSGQKTVGDKIDNIIYDAVPLRVYYGSTVPQMKKRFEDSQDSNQSLLTRKKQKTEETMPNQDASMECEFGAADSYKPDSESTLVLLGNSNQPTTKKISMMSQGCESSISNKSKSNSRHGSLKNPNGAKAVKIVHECEICGKKFQTGQALGGHKTCHRKKPVVDPFKVKLVQGKTEEQLSGETGQVRDCVTRMLLPWVLSGEADPSEESYQEHPKRLRLLGFDINIPYEG